MKKITIYILGVIVLGLASCITLEDSFIPSKNGGMLSVMASVADFSTVNVGTKAAGDDSNVESLAMIIFDKNGKLLGKPIYRNDINSSFSIDAENGKIIDGNTPIPLVPEGENGYDLSACSIYMVANAADVLSDSIIVKDNIATVEDDRTTEDKFLNIKIPVPSIGMPGNDILIPMMGKSENPVNLSTSVSEATVANVTMRKLYAKVNVRFQVNAIQVSEIPSFTINNWSVHNVPNMVRLGEQDGETICAEVKKEGDKVINVLEPTSSKVVVGNSTIYHDPSSKDYFQFTFYVPEHKVQPDITFSYPDKIQDDEKQRYKPLLCSENRNPMYVTVNGEYVDHNSIVKGVTYSLYLGQNNSDNFEVKRNQELNNFITIKGLTNNKAAAGTEEGESQFNISVDHRVDVNFDGFSLSIEREAILDSHFEVRPLDITLSPNSSMTITIPTEYQSWIAMEDNATGLETPTSAYITGKGVRKYFTTNLVSELNGKNKGTLTLENNNSENTAKHRVWIYIDENVNVYDKLLNEIDDFESPDDDTYEVVENMYRLGKINVEHIDSEGTTNVSLNMQQWNLWRVWNKDRTRYYDIEHEEEYLNNYASDQGYGQTLNGMPWGLEGITFSGNMGDGLKTKAIVAASNGGWAQDIVNGIINNLPSYYDFYLTREATEISETLVNDENNFAGRRFSNGIIDADPDGTTGDYVAIGKIQRELNDLPQSAIEYCLNKNRRSSTSSTSGLVVDRKWYLPAIDEIEQIMVGGYTDFAVFQNKEYWSCQPAYKKNFFLYNTNWFASWIGGSASDAWCDYYMENSQAARATSALYIGEDESGIDVYSYLGSGVDNENLEHPSESYDEYLRAAYDNQNPNSQSVPNNGVQLEYWDGARGGLLNTPITKYKSIYKVKYASGYNSRSDATNRIRCVFRSGTQTNPQN